MRRSPILIGAIAVLAAVVAATAAWAGPTVTGPDGNTQSIDVQVRPKKLSKEVFTPGSLEVTTLTTSVTNPHEVPSPAVGAIIDFNEGTRLYTKGLATCSAAKLQSQSTESANQLCGKAMIGGGTAFAFLTGGERVYDVEQTVTAFNGEPKGGRPTVLLHSYGTTPIQTTVVLEGTVRNYNKEGFGPRLDLRIPLIAGGKGVLKEFNVKIDKKWRFKGVQRSFISAKCPNSKKLRARGTFTYQDGESLTALSKQSCKQAA